MCRQCPVAKQKPVSFTAVGSPKNMQHIYADFQDVPYKKESITVSNFTDTQ